MAERRPRPTANLIAVRSVSACVQCVVSGCRVLQLSSDGGSSGGGVSGGGAKHRKTGSMPESLYDTTDEMAASRTKDASVARSHSDSHKRAGTDHEGNDMYQSMSSEQIDKVMAHAGDDVSLAGTPALAVYTVLLDTNNASLMLTTVSNLRPPCQWLCIQ